MTADRPHDLDRLPALTAALAVATGLATAALAAPVWFGWRALTRPEVYREPFGIGAPSLGGWLFLLGGGAAVLYGAALTAGLLAAARALRARRRHGLCLAVAVAATLFFPLGTLLGFHTINVLTLPEVRRAFGVVAPGEGERAS